MIGKYAQRSTCVGMCSAKNEKGAHSNKSILVLNKSLQGLSWDCIECSVGGCQHCQLSSLVGEQRSKLGSLQNNVKLSVKRTSKEHNHWRLPAFSLSLYIHIEWYI